MSKYACNLIYLHSVLSTWSFLSEALRQTSRSNSYLGVQLKSCKAGALLQPIYLHIFFWHTCCQIQVWPMYLLLILHRTHHSGYSWHPVFFYQTPPFSPAPFHQGQAPENTCQYPSGFFPLWRAGYTQGTEVKAQLLL